MDIFIADLEKIKADLESSELFYDLMIIGTSLLFIYETKPEGGLCMKQSLGQRDSGLPTLADDSPPEVKSDIGWGLAGGENSIKTAPRMP